MSTTPRAAVLVVIGLLAGPGIAAAGAGGNGARAIEGVWSMTLTLRDCASGNPLGPPFRTLLTFHAGGTLSESPGATGFAPGQRSAGHGLWEYSGQQTFAARFVAMILFDTPPAPPAPGFQAGWLVVGTDFTLVDVDHLSIEATADFLDLDKNVYRRACPTGSAERFQ